MLLWESTEEIDPIGKVDVNVYNPQMTHQKETPNCQNNQPNGFLLLKPPPLALLHQATGLSRQPRPPRPSPLSLPPHPLLSLSRPLRLPPRPQVRRRPPPPPPRRFHPRARTQSPSALEPIRRLRSRRHVWKMRLCFFSTPTVRRNSREDCRCLECYDVCLHPF